MLILHLIKEVIELYEQELMTYEEAYEDIKRMITKEEN